jgi:hypothetical protein
MTDRSVRFLSTLGGASTSRVLNLVQIGRQHKALPEYAARPLFLSPIINNCFILKHRIRDDEAYMFSSPRPVATKLIIPFDLDDLRSGGRSLFVDQRGFLESFRLLGHYRSDALQRDLQVIRLLHALPTLDPFLMRQYLRGHGFDVAPCYFAISEGDQKKMHDYVSHHLSRLITLALRDQGGEKAARLVKALLSDRLDHQLEPLRLTLGLDDEEFREGVFSWRGFLYYKWTLRDFWPEVMAVLAEIRRIQPQGTTGVAQRSFLANAKRTVVRMIRDHAADAGRTLEFYDRAFADLVAHQTPRTFRDFLMSAPYLFLELGEKMGAVTHIVSFWRHRFSEDEQRVVEAEELCTIFRDFTAGFAIKPKEQSGWVGRKPDLLVV